MKDSKRSRLGIIVITTLLIVGAPTTLYAVGSSRAKNEMTRIRMEAPNVHIDEGQLAATTYQPRSDDPVASALGIEDRQVSLSKSGIRWCVGIEIHRLIATRRLIFELTDGGALAEVQTCRNG